MPIRFLFFDANIEKKNHMSIPHIQNSQEVHHRILWVEIDLYPHMHEVESIGSTCDAMLQM